MAHHIRDGSKPQHHEATPHGDRATPHGDGHLYRRLLLTERVHLGVHKELSAPSTLNLSSSRFPDASAEQFMEIPPLGRPVVGFHHPDFERRAVNAMPELGSREVYLYKVYLDRKNRGERFSGPYITQIKTPKGVEDITLLGTHHTNQQKEHAEKTREGLQYTFEHYTDTVPSSKRILLAEVDAPYFPGGSPLEERFESYKKHVDALWKSLHVHSIEDATRLSEIEMLMFCARARDMPILPISAPAEKLIDQLLTNQQNLQITGSDIVLDQANKSQLQLTFAKKENTSSLDPQKLYSRFMKIYLQSNWENPNVSRAYNELKSLQKPTPQEERKFVITFLKEINPVMMENSKACEGGGFGKGFNLFDINRDGSLCLGYDPHNPKQFGWLFDQRDTPEGEHTPLQRIARYSQQLNDETTMRLAIEVSKSGWSPLIVGDWGHVGRIAALNDLINRPTRWYTTNRDWRKWTY